jgi:hypothetical protein
MQPMKTSKGSLFILGALVAGLCVIPARPVAAQNFTNLHSFSALTNAINTDGRIKDRI